MIEKQHYRHEYKFDLTLGQYYELRPRLRAVMRPDAHAGPDGHYIISSTYFDNYMDKALREKNEGIARREKFRIRWYNGDLSALKLEKKIKDNNLCLKISSNLTAEEYKRITEGDINWMRDDDRALVRELYLKYKGELIRPRVIVSYLREPYVYDPGNVRVTFDSDVRSSLYKKIDADPRYVDVDARMEPGHLIMEVKYDEYLPEVIGMILQTKNVRQSSFSKYGVCRRFG